MVPLRFDFAPVRARVLAPFFALIVAVALVVVADAMAATGHSHDSAAATTKETTAAAKPAAKAAPAAPDSLPRLEAAVKKDSTDVKAVYRLGIAYLDRDRPQEAAGLFHRATMLKPDYVEAWVNAGAAEDAIGHGAAARLAYRKALELRPTDEIAQCRMASSFYATGMKDSAMAMMRETLAKNPRSSCSYFTMGVAYADASMFREAIRVWQKVVEYSPGSPEAESAKESIKLLQEYLGPQDALAEQKVVPAGVPMGAGGPGEPIKGGEMNGASKTPNKASAPKDPKSPPSSASKTTTTTTTTTQPTGGK
jgi:tetratricopeptide (TPR) repeat protein